MIVSLYAGGMTIADIEHHLATTIGTELSRETISKITDEVLDESWAGSAARWRPLYPVIFIDALVVKVRDGAHVVNKSAHIAVGVDMDGVKHVLGIWIQTNEGAKLDTRVVCHPELRLHKHTRGPAPAQCNSARANGFDATNTGNIATGGTSGSVTFDTTGVRPSAGSATTPTTSQ